GAAYERGQLRRALLEAAPIVPMTLLALVASGGLLPIAIGGLLLAATVWLSWTGGERARGVSPGLAAGALLVATPLLARQCAVVCVGPLCWSTCIAACAVAGIGGGVVLARGWPPDASPSQRLVSLLLASTAAAMGCVEIGLAGLALAVVMLTISGSALATSRLRRHP
ncbi:MAG: hypothetical protein ACI8S6_002755, partial [Myxococcota bacterium]